MFWAVNLLAEVTSACVVNKVLGLRGIHDRAGKVIGNDLLHPVGELFESFDH